LPPPTTSISAWSRGVPTRWAHSRWRTSSASTPPWPWRTPSTRNSRNRSTLRRRCWPAWSKPDCSVANPAVASTTTRPDGVPGEAVGNEWIRRDAAVVWHGFTQMGAYAANSPLVIDRAAGRELIDVDGRCYLDAISSLWVNTLGHRVPELDAALAAQGDKVAHSTMLGNGTTVVVELAEALAGVVPVDAPHFLFAADGAVAVEQALKIAFQYWVNRGVEGRTQYLALGDAYHGDTIGSLSLGDGGVFSAVFDPLCFPVVRTPGYADPGWAAKACAAVESRASELAAVVIEPLVQGASGMLCAEAAD